MASRVLDKLMAHVARLVGCTLGQAYTLVVGFLVAVVLLATGVPPALEHRDVAPAVAQAPRSEVPPPPVVDAAPSPAPAPPPPIADFGLPPAFPQFPGDTVTTTTMPPYDAWAPDDEPPPPPASPLEVVVSGWASLSGGTPAAAVGVPLGTLPVGNRVGTADKVSFVRLVGTADFLVLPTDPDGQREPVVGTVAVEACPIEEAGWQGREGASFEESPTWDAERCVPGMPAASGHWSFDLGAFPGRSGDRGFALVPAPDAAADFQVAFSPS